MASIFSKIIAGEIPCYKIAEDDHNFAFLDISPIKKGHVLVVPKQEVDYIYDLSDQALTSLNLFAKKVAKAIEATISCKRIGVCIIGLEVPHAHIHLIPMDVMGDVNFSKPKLSFSEAEMKKLSVAIAQNFNL